MKENNYTRNYIYNGQPTDMFDIPPNADFFCILTDEDDQQLFIESYQSAVLSCLEGHCRDGETVDQAAQRTVELAQDTLEPLEISVPVKIYFDPSDIEPPFVIEDCFALAPHRRFEYSPFEQSLDIDSPAKYCLELIAQEPLGLIFKRAWLDADKQLLSIEYPLYELGDGNTLKEGLCFSEFSTRGETLLMNSRDPEYSDENKDEYICPAGRDDYLDAVKQYTQRNFFIYLDANFEPIEPEKISEPEEVHALYYGDDQETLLAADHFVNLQLGHSEVFDVPLDQHYFVFHAYMRQIHREMKLISTDPMKAPHYVRVHSPMMDSSSDNIQLEAGQTRQHTSIFYFAGNLVVHECTIFNDDGSHARKYWLRSPTNDEIVLDADDPNSGASAVHFGP